jgi:hypothetical protein
MSPERFHALGPTAYAEVIACGRSFRLRLVNERNRHATLKPTQLESLSDAMQTGLAIFSEVAPRGQWPWSKFFDVGHRAMIRFFAHGREDLRFSIHESTDTREWTLPLKGFDKVKAFADWLKNFAPPMT